MAKDNDEIQKIQKQLEDIKDKHSALTLKYANETTKLNKKIAKLEKETQYCYWGNVKYSVGATHSENNNIYICTGDGKWSNW